MLKLTSHPVLSTFSCGFNHLRPASIFGGLSTIIIEQVNRRDRSTNDRLEGRKISNIYKNQSTVPLCTFLQNKACSYTCLELIRVKVREMHGLENIVGLFLSNCARHTFLNQPGFKYVPRMGPRSVSGEIDPAALTLLSVTDQGRTGLQKMSNWLSILVGDKVLPGIDCMMQHHHIRGHEKIASPYSLL